MVYIKWNWRHDTWPHFTYDAEVLKTLELQFYQNTGTVLGVLKHMQEPEKEDFLIDILSKEALKTSEIEGEYLDKDSVQLSIKQNLGLTADKRRIPPAAYGISEMMVDLYLHFDRPLTHHQLFEWHKMLTNGRRDLVDIGQYRTHKEPMQVVSGRLDKPSIHFEAPPSDHMPKEMEQFITWFHTNHFEKNKN